MSRLETILLIALVIAGFLVLRSCDKAADERAKTAAAVVQSKVDTGNAAIADRVAVEHVTIITRTEETASAVEAIPSDDLPADVRTDWCGGLRYSTCGRPNPDRPGELPATVPGAEP